MIGGIDQIHAERANGLLLKLCRGVPEVDMEKNLIRLAIGFGLEPDTEPAVLLVGSLIIPGGDSVRKNEKSSVGTASFGEPGNEELIFVVEHRQEAFLGDVARASAVRVVADGLVVGRDGLRDRSRSSASAQKPTRHFLTGANLGKRPVAGSLQIDGQSLGVNIGELLGYVGGGHERLRFVEFTIAGSITQNGLRRLPLRRNPGISPSPELR